MVEISVKAEAVQALLREMNNVEALQLKVGEDMATLLYEQVRLAEKFRLLRNAMGELVK